MLVTIPFFALETLNLVKEGNESIKEYKGKQNGNMKTSQVYFKPLYLIVLILNNLILFNYSKMSNNLEFWQAKYRNATQRSKTKSISTVSDVVNSQFSIFKRQL